MIGLGLVLSGNVFAKPEYYGVFTTDNLPLRSCQLDAVGEKPLSAAKIVSGNITADAIQKAIEAVTEQLGSQVKAKNYSALISTKINVTTLSQQPEKVLVVMSGVPIEAIC
jgi:hypothetical protein